MSDLDREAIGKIHELISGLKWDIKKQEDARAQIKGYEVSGKLSAIQGKIEEYLATGREIE